jgi:cation diffusion facilitator CzcD-associated flavoprotein CzcO
MASGNGDRPNRLSVGIVGAGFGGVGMAIKLKQQGYTDLTVFERGESVGGVWRANTYPGAACDVPSHLYSFSFAPGHNWSRRYAPQAEILDYLADVSRQYQVDQHLRLGIEVTDARDQRRLQTRVRPAGHGLRPADEAGDPGDSGRR